MAKRKKVADQDTVDERQDLERTPVFGAIEDEIVAPDFVYSAGFQAATRFARIAQSATFALLRGYLHALATPNSLDLLVIHSPTLADEDTVDSTILITWE